MNKRNGLMLVILLSAVLIVIFAYVFVINADRAQEYQPVKIEEPQPEPETQPEEITDSAKEQELKADLTRQRAEQISFNHSLLRKIS